MKKYLLTLSLLLTLCSARVFAQRFEWEVLLDSRFDNREYKSELNWPQTLFGARLTPQVGIGWGEGSSLMAGVDLMADFGAGTFATKPDVLFYYKYLSPRFNAYAGVFQRNRTMGSYSTALFSDSVRFYDANLEGLMLQYRGGHGFVELGLDWNSRISDTRREKFMIFSAGELRDRWLAAGYAMWMYHYAGTLTQSGVVDNVLVNPYLSFDLKRFIPLDSLTLRVGYLQALQNDRNNENVFVKPGGVLAELRLEWRRFGIFDSFYYGDNIMPYYERYGNGLYPGDPFFRTSDMYNRLEIYWEPIRRDDMRLRIASVHHYDGKVWDWQQVASFSIMLGHEKFRKKR